MQEAKLLRGQGLAFCSGWQAHVICTEEYVGAWRLGAPLQDAASEVPYGFREATLIMWGNTNVAQREAIMFVWLFKRPKNH